jgi:transposase
VTFVAALRQNGLTAPFVVDCAMNGAIFIEYVRQCLLPTLAPGDIMHLPAHKHDQVRELIERAGAQLRYLPPYSPDLNRIEPSFAQLKAYLAKERTVPALYDRTGSSPHSITSTQSRNYFRKAGYAST